MAKQNPKWNNFSEDFFLSRGYTKNAFGGFDPPKFKHKVFGENEDIPTKIETNKTENFTSKPITEWFIPYQIPSKKNSRQVFVHPKTKKLMNIPSKSYTEYKTATSAYWKAFGLEFNETVKKLQLNKPYNIHMTFIRKTNQLVDFFGPGESAFDLMTDFGWWEDDNSKVAKPFFGDMIVDKNNPGTKIKILLDV